MRHAEIIKFLNQPMLHIGGGLALVFVLAVLGITTGKFGSNAPVAYRPAYEVQLLPSYDEELPRLPSTKTEYFSAAVQTVSPGDVSTFDLAMACIEKNQFRAAFGLSHQIEDSADRSQLMLALMDKLLLVGDIEFAAEVVRSVQDQLLRGQLVEKLARYRAS